MPSRQPNAGERLRHCVTASAVLAAVAALMAVAGCRPPLRLEPAPAGEQLRDAQRSILTTDSLSGHTTNVLNLEGLPAVATDDVADRLESLCERNPRPERLIALAEVCYAIGVRQPGTAGWDRLALSALASWTALFGGGDELPRLGAQWELARTILNASLAQAIVALQVLPGSDATIVETTVAGHPVRVEYGWDAAHWSPDRFVRFLAADDFRVLGLRNRNRQSGIGAPLLAERVAVPDSESPSRERLLPSSYQAVALSAVIDEVDFGPGTGWPPTGFSLRIVDPARTPAVAVSGTAVPVEADFSAALAHTLAGSEPLRSAGLGGLRRVESWRERMGLYLLEPFDCDRVPVVFLHGLISSPLVWREMVNDLWSDPEIRSRYQFWFFLYPTGQPFVVSAAELRAAFTAARDIVDPDRTCPSFDRTVLVGHSMGGLLARRLTMDPGEALWNAFSDVPFDDAVMDDDDRERARRYLLDGRMPEVSRIVLIAVPGRGARMADGPLGRLGSRLVELPPSLVDAAGRVFEANPDKRLRVSSSGPWPVPTGIDSLSPRSPFLRTFADLPLAPDVAVNSIVGRRDDSSEPGGTDGVVPFTSSHMPDAESELVIPNTNHSVPLHPAAAIEVRRILYRHAGIGPAPEPGAAPVGPAP